MSQRSQLTTADSPASSRLPLCSVPLLGPKEKELAFLRDLSGPQIPCRKSVDVVAGPRLLGRLLSLSARLTRPFPVGCPHGRVCLLTRRR